MRADELIELFGDTVTTMFGNPYMGRELTKEEIQKLEYYFFGAISLKFEEKARESDPAR